MRNQGHSKGTRTMTGSAESELSSTSKDHQGRFSLAKAGSTEDMLLRCRKREGERYFELFLHFVL